MWRLGDAEHYSIYPSAFTSPCFCTQLLQSGGRVWAFSQPALLQARDLTVWTAESLGFSDSFEIGLFLGEG